MKNEYIIINKTQLLKRIEELFIEAKELLEEDGLEWQDEFLNYKDFSPNFEEYSDNFKYFYIIMGKIESLQDYLSQSTPLIPEIQNGIYAGYKFARQNFYNADNTLQPKVQEYISNLKLDI